MRPLRTVHPPYRDRRDAGQALAEALGQHLHEPNLLILGLPRGGVAVAYEVAKALHAPLDIFGWCANSACPVTRNTRWAPSPAAG